MAVSYNITASDLAERFDIDVIGQLATDDRDPLLRDAILAPHTNVQTALNDAIGDFDIKMRVGKRYTQEQLENLDQWSEAHMKRIICVITMSHLFRRRPGMHTEMADAIRKEADDWLSRLQRGEDIFGIGDDDTSPEDASIPELQGPTSVEIENRNFLAARMSGRVLPGIKERNPLDRG